MAVYETFRCNECDHEHYGFEGDTATMREWSRALICPDCREITGITLGDTTDRDGAVLPKKTPRYPRCKSCGGQRLKIWHAKNGCPQCGGTMAPDPDGPSVCAD